ncbi:hypothetical protein FP568_19140 [Pandoraea pnomenusa]|nr:hypothetical protein FP568_19140 [Pandoraea pnomenusa]
MPASPDSVDAADGHRQADGAGGCRFDLWTVIRHAWEDHVPGCEDDGAQAEVGDNDEREQPFQAQAQATRQ